MSMCVLRVHVCAHSGCNRVLFRALGVISFFYKVGTLHRV